MYVQLDQHELLNNTSVSLLSLGQPDQFHLFEYNIVPIVITIVKVGQSDLPDLINESL